MTKEQLRILYKEKRKSLSLPAIEKWNDLILINFQKIQLPVIHCVHTYLASLKLREADTSLLIRYLEFRYPGLKVAAPKINPHTDDMQHFLLNDDVELVANGYGIEEPAKAKELPTSAIDLVLVPLLAFDEKGYRAGYGKGYYDRFLSACRQDTIKVGLSFFDAVDKIEDVNAYDISLDFCVTPHRVYDFGS